MRLFARIQQPSQFRTWCFGLVVGFFCWGATTTTWASADLAVAVYQSLGVKKRLPKILESVRAAYTLHTGENALPLSNINMNLEDYGLKKLGSCAQKVPCLVRVSRENLPKDLTYALYLGVGAIGQKILIRFLLLDLKKGTIIKQKNQSFNGIGSLQKGLPSIIVSFFPNYAKIKISGRPIGAKIQINTRDRGTLPAKTMSVPSGRPISIRIFAPKYKDWSQKLTLTKGQTKHIQAKLLLAKPKKRMIARKNVKRKPPPPPPPSSPFYTTWWFWTATGVVVAGGVVVGVGVAASGQDRITGAFPFK